MVKIRLFDGEEVDKSEAFLDLVKHESGFAVVLKDEDGDIVVAPYVLFLSPDPESGKITLSLASFVNGDYVERGETGLSSTIKINSTC